MYFSTTLILLIIVVLDILVYFIQKLHEEDNDEQKSSSSLVKRSMHQENHGDNRNLSLSSSSLYNQCRVFSLAEIKLATNDFDEAYVIGKGGFGKVYKTKVDLGGGIDVAIKRLDIDSNQGATEFWAEIEMLSKFRHSHIVSLLGYCEKEMILVYEYMPNGSLADHLHKKRMNKSNSSPLTWIQRLNICIGAARGLDYLHTGTGVQHRVIHRDVKSSNILLDENWAGKIADFGVSRTTPASPLGSTTNVYTGQIISTFGYMDAEYFSTHRLTRKSDVYAFGVVLLEVLCGTPALDFTLDEQQHSLAGWAKHCIKKGSISRIIDPCLSGQVSAKCINKFGQIAYECLRACSKDRPTMTMVLARLEFVLKWTMQSLQRAANQKHIGKSVFIEKAWSIFLTKAPRRVIHGNVATASQQLVSLSDEATLHLKGFTYSELRTATMSFHRDRFIGEGGFGKVFKGWLDRVTYTPQKGGHGMAVAIKKLEPTGFQGIREWQTEVNIMVKFSHPNIVKLLGYCQENNKFLIVYEFMQRGSLENHMFRNVEEVLPWYTRIKIAIEAAQGLAFLHTAENNVMYRDMKSSNILLDEDFNAKLSDFGLARLGPAKAESHVTTRIMGTFGYAAPEYISTGHLYVKSDVYGFGVVMLEIISGLRAFDCNRDAIMHNLAEWARPFLSDINGIHRVMDPRLKRNYPSKAAHEAAMLILTCLEPEPENRPCMKDIVSCLQGIYAIKMNPSNPEACEEIKVDPLAT